MYVVQTLPTIKALCFLKYIFYQYTNSATKSKLLCALCGPRVQLFCWTAPFSLNPRSRTFSQKSTCDDRMKQCGRGGFPRSNVAFDPPINRCIVRLTPPLIQVTITDIHSGTSSLNTIRPQWGGLWGRAKGCSWVQWWECVTKHPRNSLAVHHEWLSTVNEVFWGPLTHDGFTLMDTFLIQWHIVKKTTAEALIIYNNKIIAQWFVSFHSEKKTHRVNWLGKRKFSRHSPVSLFF